MTPANSRVTTGTATRPLLLQHEPAFRPIAVTTTCDGPMWRMSSWLAFGLGTGFALGLLTFIFVLAIAVSITQWR